MEVSVVTVWYSENYGSYWQAKSLGDYLSSKGHSITYLNTINKKSSHSKKYLSTLLIRNILKGNFYTVIPLINKYRKFDQCLKKIPIIRLDECINSDVLIFGSDTLWDMDSSYFRESAKIFWGLPFKNKKISYAPSVANTALKTLKNIDYIYPALNDFSSISVRDKYSADIIGSLINKEVSIVTDPTFLMAKEYYVKQTIPIKESNFILIYLFDDITKEFSNAIINFAEKNNLRLIALGRSVKWADKTVFPGPEEFLTYFSKSDYIITNTFHGTIFSLIFEKEFLSFSKGKRKVDTLLTEYDLLDRSVKEINNLEKIFNTRIDYGQVKNKIINNSYFSQNFLIKSLLNIEEKKDE